MLSMIQNVVHISSKDVDKIIDHMTSFMSNSQSQTEAIIYASAMRIKRNLSATTTPSSAENKVNSKSITRPNLVTGVICQAVRI